MGRLGDSVYAAIRGQIVLAGVHLSLAAVRASPGPQLPHQGHTSAAKSPASFASPGLWREGRFTLVRGVLDDELLSRGTETGPSIAALQSTPTTS